MIIFTLSYFRLFKQPILVMIHSVENKACLWQIMGISYFSNNCLLDFFVVPKANRIDKCNANLCKRNSYSLYIVIYLYIEFSIYLYSNYK